MREAGTRHLTVGRTARWTLLGDPDGPVRQLWIALHGYGQLADTFARSAAALARPGCVVAVPEALSRFYAEPARPGHAGARVGASWMTREDREADIRDNLAYLDALHAHLLQRLARAPDAVLRVLGFSQGAATASRWAARGAARVESVICWGAAPAHDLGPDDFARLRTSRLILVAGDRDELFPPEQVERAAAALRAEGIPPQLIRFPGGHRLDDPTLRRLSET